MSCPGWCEYGEGHPYDLEDAEGFQQRHHCRVLGLADASVDIGTLATCRGDHEELEPLSIRMMIDCDAVGPDLTHKRAEVPASLLETAAKWLEARA